MTQTCLFLSYEWPPAALCSTSTLLGSPNAWLKKWGEAQALRGPKCCHSPKQSENTLSDKAHRSFVHPFYLAAPSALLSSPFITTTWGHNWPTTQVIQETRINVKPLWRAIALVMLLNCWWVVLNQVANETSVGNISDGIHKMMERWRDASRNVVLSPVMGSIWVHRQNKLKQLSAGWEWHTLNFKSDSLLQNECHSLRNNVILSLRTDKQKECVLAPIVNS